MFGKSLYIYIMQNLQGVSLPVPVWLIDGEPFHGKTLKHG